MERAVCEGAVTSKGQVTVPKEVRDRLGLKQGDRLQFILENGKTVVRRAKRKHNVFAKYAGMFPAFDGDINKINLWVRDMRGE